MTICYLTPEYPLIRLKPTVSLVASIKNLAVQLVQEGVALQKDVHTIYKYLHFQSMPKEPPVFWLKKPDDLKTVLSNLESEKAEVLKHARQWFEIINYSEPQRASQRMVHHLKNNL